ncbi:Uncharacterized protein APZ42_025571 [Daphnia magna]|uniref:Uncharacterized protein n=1 Tax=Daphnia magna TaxID=35525 RepID=A0A164SXW8_9CRUS|nr:Uncharacterized protein APZ42_025571 [Daphnia magna]
MWKTDNVNIPNNRSTALKRLYVLERRFNRDEDFSQKYDAVVKKYIGLKHAKLLTAEESRKESSKRRFLHHHRVKYLGSLDDEDVALKRALKLETLL